MPDSATIRKVLHYQVVYCVRDAIDGMRLPGLEQKGVEVRKLDWDGIFAYPGISVVPMKEIEGQGTNIRDQIGYGVLIVMNMGTARGTNENADVITYWRKAVRSKFNKQRVCMREVEDGVSETGTCPILCEVSHETIEVPEQFKKNRDWGYLMLRFWFMESRTTPQGE